MIGVESLITKINTLIAGGSLTEDQIVQLSGAVDALENHGVSSVATTNDLPNPVTNKGRFIFVEKESRYVFSDGIKWDISNIIDTSGLRLYAWGDNGSARLGDGTTTNRSSPVYVVGGFTDWIKVEPGAAHGIGIRANGTAWSWGSNTNGQLGDNTTINRSSPVAVVGGYIDWTLVTAGSGHNLAIRANGTMWSWGSNGFGTLGDGTTAGKSSPVSVVSGGAAWIHASAGLIHSLGIQTNGTLWAWGSNTYGRLGDGTTATKSSPVSVASGAAIWIHASAGDFHSLGIQSNGTMWAWGRNNYGQLGDNSVVSKSSPIAVVGGFTDWVSSAAGTTHSIGIRANGTIWGWGNKISGRVGDNTGGTSTLSPVIVAGGFTDWIDASAGDDQSLGIRANGTVWMWGSSYRGKLGDNTIVAKNSPVAVVGGFTDWVSGATKFDHSIAIRG